MLINFDSPQEADVSVWDSSRNRGLQEPLGPLFPAS